ncbi:MAG: DUF6152 family protein [Steroidobacteraceae bacterium]
MKINFKSIALLAIGAAAICQTATAHHSFAMFDLTKSITLNGTVKTFEWTNPHSWLWLTVKAEDGTDQTWGIETGSPSMLLRRGMQRTVFKAGDKVAVEIHPNRDGTTGGNFMKATFPDGRTYAIVVGKEEQ